MPYVWDGHDNATRVQETGHGMKMDRYAWTDDDLARGIETMLNDQDMQAILAQTSRHMRAQDGPTRAAELLCKLL